MVSRRIFFKSMSILSGGIVLASTPVSNLAAKSSIISGTSARKRQIVVVGNEKSAAPYMDTLSENIQFADFESFLASGIAADTILFTGIKNSKPTILKALKSGYHVWSDRPVAFTPLACKKFNNIAAGYFCKIHIAHVIGNEICLMENKIYSARV